MDKKDLMVVFVISVVVIIGVYQFYFFPQRHPIFKAREPKVTRWLDEKIPFRPLWIWVYSFLYYPVILALIFTINSFYVFCYTVFSYIVLMAMQLFFSFLFL